MTKGWTNLRGDQRQVIALLDCGAHVNLISQKFVTQWDLEPCDAVLPQPEALSGQSMYCYGAYKLDYWLVDSWGHGRKCSTLFYAVDQKGPDIVLGMPGLCQLHILLDPEAAQWRFKVNAGNLQVEKPAKFTRSLEREPNVFAIVCAAAAGGNPAIANTGDELALEYEQDA